MSRIQLNTYNVRCAGGDGTITTLAGPSMASAVIRYVALLNPPQAVYQIEGSEFSSKLDRPEPTWRRFVVTLEELPR